MNQPPPIAELTSTGRMIALAAALAGWTFAGLEIALFVVVARPAVVSMLGTSGGENAVAEWFAWLQAAFLLGAAAGGWLFGWLGDRFGRTRAMGWSVLCYSLGTGLCWFARSPGELLVLRAIACLGIGGAWPNTVALVAEAWPVASRPFLAGLLGAAANVGQILMATLAIVWSVSPDSWRWTMLVCATPAVVGLWCLIGVPESPRWLAARDKRKSGEGDPLRELFGADLRRRTIIGILLGAVPVIGTAANAQWIVPWTDHVQAEQRAAKPNQPAPKPNPKAKAWTMIYRSTGATIGSLLGGTLAALLGRRTTYFVVSLATLACSTWVFGWLDPMHPWFNTAAFVFGLVGVIYFGWLPLYLPELFPTRVRATGTGVAFNTGRAVAAGVTLATGALVKWFGGDYARIGLWTGGVYAAGMAIVLFAPRTDGADSKG